MDEYKRSLGYINGWYAAIRAINSVIIEELKKVSLDGGDRAIINFGIMLTKKIVVDLEFKEKENGN